MQHTAVQIFWTLFHPFKSIHTHVVLHKVMATCIHSSAVHTDSHMIGIHTHMYVRTYVHTPTSWLNRDGGRARIGGWRGGGTVNGWTRCIRWTGWKGNTCNWKDSTWKDRTLNIWTCSGWSGHNWSCCNKWIKREEKKASCSKPFMRVKLAATIYWLWESRLRIIFPTYYNNQVSVVDSRSELTAVSTSPQTQTTKHHSLYCCTHLAPLHCRWPQPAGQGGAHSETPSWLLLWG